MWAQRGVSVSRGRSNQFASRQEAVGIAYRCGGAAQFRLRIVQIATSASGQRPAAKSDLGYNMQSTSAWRSPQICSLIVTVGLDARPQGR